MEQQNGNGQARLAKKLAQILAGIERVPRSGYNDFHDYTYATESDVLDHLREKLAKHNVAILPSVADSTEQEIETKNSVQTLATVDVQVTLIDGDSGEERTQIFKGQGMDSGDKAYYKAYAGAMKYWAMKTFLMPTGDDPEGDQRTDQATAARPNPDKISPPEFSRDFEMPFGEHEGEPLRDVPTDYLEWVAEEAYKQYMRTFAERELEEREMDQSGNGHDEQFPDFAGNGSNGSGNDLTINRNDHGSLTRRTLDQLDSVANFYYPGDGMQKLRKRIKRGDYDDIHDVDDATLRKLYKQMQHRVEAMSQLEQDVPDAMLRDTTIREWVENVADQLYETDLDSLNTKEFTAVIEQIRDSVGVQTS